MKQNFLQLIQTVQIQSASSAFPAVALPYMLPDCLHIPGSNEVKLNAFLIPAPSLFSTSQVFPTHNTYALTSIIPVLKWRNIFHMATRH
jgi:hypothetical protein